MLTFSKRSREIIPPTPSSSPIPFSEHQLIIIAPQDSVVNTDPPVGKDVNVQISEGFETKLALHLQPTKEATVDCSCGMSFFKRFRSKT